MYVYIYIYIYIYIHTQGLQAEDPPVPPPHDAWRRKAPRVNSGIFKCEHHKFENGRTTSPTNRYGRTQQRNQHTQTKPNLRNQTEK